MYENRLLIKPMVIVSTDHYLESVVGSYLADVKKNNASITKHILLNNWGSVVNWLQPSDILIVDRGFRDCLPLLNDSGYDTYTPASRRKVDK